MKKRIFSILLCLSLLFSAALVRFPALADDEVWDGSVSVSLSGSGTYAEPYLIKSGADLAYLAEQVNAGTDYAGKLISLENDIVLNANHADYESWGTSAPANAWTPIGKTGKYFRGIFDGKDHTIYGMYTVSGDSYEFGTGLFGAVHNNKIMNLHIQNSYVRGRFVVGGFVGQAQETTFQNCSFEGFIYSSNTTNYAGSTGGFLGKAAAGNSLEKCYTAGTLSAYARSAGLIGAARDAGTNTITNSYSTMTVTGLGAKDSAGGGTGGLVGFVENGTVTLTNSFFAGTYPNGSIMRGPIVAHIFSATVTDTNCYYLADAADEKNGAYGTNKTAEEFKNGTVLALLNTDSENPVFMQGTDFPVFGQDIPEEPKNEVLSGELITDWITLAATEFASGTGEEADPYIIKTAGQLAKIAADAAAGETFAGKYFKIEEDIVLNTDTDFDNWKNLTEGTLYRWTPIGNRHTYFKGTINGGGHTVTGMYVNKTLLYGLVDCPDGDDNYVGFIGNGHGKISNLHFENAYVCGHRYVGGIGGNYGGTLTNCSYSGYVRGTSNINYAGHIGGLVGGVNVSVNINECYTTGRMNALSRAGGLIGSIMYPGSSTIKYSYSEMTFDKTFANDGVSEPKSGIAGILGFAQLGTVSMKMCFYYGQLDVSSSFSGPITGHIPDSATVTDLENVFYLEGNKTDSVGRALSARKFKNQGFLTYFTDSDGIVRATLNSATDLHPMLLPVFIIKGDVNFDSFLDLADAMLVLRHIESIEELTGDAVSLANMDGGDITLTDYSAVKERVLNAINLQE